MKKRIHFPSQTDEQFDEEQYRRNLPWTDDDYETVRVAATTLVRSHKSHDEPNGEVLTVVDGHAFWRLLGALDRTS